MHKNTTFCCKKASLIDLLLAILPEMHYFPDMTDSELIAMLQEKHSERITWYTRASFYADTAGNIFEDGVLLYLTDVTFRVYAPDFEDYFTAIDILYTDDVRKTDAIELISGHRSKINRINPISAMFTETVLALDFGKNRYRFLKIRKPEFLQLLRVAQAKQKYSLTVSARNPMQDSEEN